MQGSPPRVSISSDFPAFGESSRPAASESNTLIDYAVRGGKDRPIPHGGPDLSDLSGPTHDAEALAGHIYALAEQLDEEDEEPVPSEHVHEEFPDGVPRVPVPDRFLDALDELNGSAVRLAVVLLEAASVWDDQQGQWRTSPRYWTLTRLQARHGLGMTRQSARNAADELESIGLLNKGERGEADAFRWAPTTPDGAFTYVPLALLREQSRLSPRALTVLLSVYRATWGWTLRLAGTLQHRRTSRLTTADLKGMTGLSAPTIRQAADELERKGAVHRGRPHRGASWFWTPIVSFFHNPRQNSYVPGISPNRNEGSKELCNHTTRTRGRDRRSEPRSGGSVSSKGRGEGQDRRDTSLSERQKRDVKRLTSDPFDLPFWLAAKLVNSRSAEVLHSTFGGFRRQREQIENPGGWMIAALRNLWYAPTATEGGTKNLEGGPASGGHDPVGLHRTEMVKATDALTKEGDWEQVGEGRFIPSKEFAKWCELWTGQLGTDRAERWADRLISVRRSYDRRNLD